jgi:hypothetical protein
MSFWNMGRMMEEEMKDKDRYDPEKIKKDKWAMKAIEYLVRKEYSSKEVIEAMVEVGVRRGVKDESVNIK